MLHVVKLDTVEPDVLRHARCGLVMGDLPSTHPLLPVWHRHRDAICRDHSHEVASLLQEAHLRVA